MGNPAQSLEDEYKWALETAAALRAGNFDAIDREALVNELERSIAGGFKRQLYEHTRDALRARLSLKLLPRCPVWVASAPKMCNVQRPIQ